MSLRKMDARRFVGTSTLLPGDAHTLVSLLHSWTLLSIPCRDCGALAGELCWIWRDGRRTNLPAQDFHAERRHGGRAIYDAAWQALMAAICPVCGGKLPRFPRDGWHRCPAVAPALPVAPEPPPPPRPDDQDEAQRQRLRWSGPPPAPSEPLPPEPLDAPETEARVAVLLQLEAMREQIREMEQQLLSGGRP